VPGIVIGGDAKSFKTLTQEDRELLKELWRKRQSQRSAELERLTRTGMSRARSDLNLSSDSSGSTWWLVIPSQRVRPRVCDEVPDEFRRAGIGLCFEGELDKLDRPSLTDSIFLLLSLTTWGLYYKTFNVCN
jgi:hypothetical protein